MHCARQNTIRRIAGASQDEQTMNVVVSRRHFCSHAVALAIFGGAIGSILEECSSPTSPTNAPALAIVNGTLGAISTDVTSGR
jgi:hypothetical protein